MPHSDHSPSPACESFVGLPPFPDNVPTAPLLRISLSKLLQHDAEEQERCWKACCELGFFYLDVRTGTSSSGGGGGDGDEVCLDGTALLEDVDALFDVMKPFFDVDVAEKVKYDFKEQGSYFGYKGYGGGYVDKQGTKDRNEFYNISKDDILHLTPPLPAPSILTPHRPLYKSYIRSSHAICMLITSILSTRLPLSASARSKGGLPAFHNLLARSGDQIRFVKAPAQEPSLKGVALGEHTDFGSVTVLFNRLGGLQVRLPPGMEASRPTVSEPRMSDVETKLCEDGWTYVRPLPGHCIVNLGDALVKFSEGRLRSNIHRVVAPPGDQAAVDRYSLVYFCRPEDEVVLGSLIEGGQDKGEEQITAKDWILRRALGRRERDGWEMSEGTERVSMRSGGMKV
ncbi:Clavaminate synthase-like protein [Stemphylium lycopersici]|uniref:Clavaminate synthase-like protein n=1 Tax=Stemphylium lycopersici TaxID=183478 RepID=A0A364NBH0_STELY|nr:Clavaminate synthase-like protein [Stemphylium lycopersici]RAR14582.1 Clavaminate synthase-like protein [Stemphylium lycopersici]